MAEVIDQFHALDLHDREIWNLSVLQGSSGDWCLAVDVIVGSDTQRLIFLNCRSIKTNIHGGMARRDLINKFHATSDSDVFRDAAKWPSPLKSGTLHYSITTSGGSTVDVVAEAFEIKRNLTNRVVISIRINHPSWPLDRVTELMKSKPDIGRSVGEQRRTPQGQELEGKNSETHWIKAVDYEGDSLPDAIEKAMTEFGRQSAAGREIRQSGGKVELFLGWFFDKNGGDVLPAELLDRLSELGIDLSFDIYGPEMRIVTGRP